MDDFNKTPNIYPNLNAIPSNEQQFRVNKINEIKYIFLAKVRERELISKNVSKYIASLDYFDKSLNVLSILSWSISIASFASVIGAPSGIIGASCGLTFSITSGFIEKFLKTIRNKKKNRNKIVMLARGKLNSIESKISKALMDREISHEDIGQLLMKKKNIDNWKKALEWWAVKEVMLRKLTWLKKAKKWVLMRLLSVMKLLITV